MDALSWESENIVLDVAKYWTRLRLVQYFATARTIFSRIINVHNVDERGKSHVVTYRLRSDHLPLRIII